MFFFIRIRYCSKFFKKNINSFVFELWKVLIGVLFCCKVFGKWEECCRRIFVCGFFFFYWFYFVIKCSSYKLLVIFCLVFFFNFGICRLMYCLFVKFVENDFLK